MGLEKIVEEIVNVVANSTYMHVLTSWSNYTYTYSLAVHVQLWVWLWLASSPGPKRGPGTHCLRMSQSVPRFLVHRIFLCIPVRISLRNWLLSQSSTIHYSADREVYGNRCKHDNCETTWPIVLLRTVYGRMRRRCVPGPLFGPGDEARLWLDLEEVGSVVRSRGCSGC